MLLSHLISLKTLDLSRAAGKLEKGKISRPRYGPGRGGPGNLVLGYTSSNVFRKGFPPRLSVLEDDPSNVFRKVSLQDSLFLKMTLKR